MPTCSSPPTPRPPRPAISCAASAPGASGARVLLVATAGTVGAAQQALDCGAVGFLERPLDGPALRHALAAAGCFDRASSTAGDLDEGHIALLGAGGGMGTTTCVVALASASERAFVLDLALATGDAAEVAAARVLVPDAMLRIACGPLTAPAELAAGLAEAPACRVLPAPTLPEHADLIDEHGIARVLDLAHASDLRAIADCGSRLGVETIPVLERSCVIAIVASADARGVRGARRASLLIARLDLTGRDVGLVVTSATSTRGAEAVAAQVGLPLVAAVKADARVPRARERGTAPRRRVRRARRARADTGRVNLWERTQLASAAAPDGPSGPVPRLAARTRWRACSTIPASPR